MFGSVMPPPMYDVRGPGQMSHSAPNKHGQVHGSISHSLGTSHMTNSAVLMGSDQQGSMGHKRARVPSRVRIRVHIYVPTLLDSLVSFYRNCHVVYNVNRSKL